MSCLNYALRLLLLLLLLSTEAITLHVPVGSVPQGLYLSTYDLRYTVIFPIFCLIYLSRCVDMEVLRFRRSLNGLISPSLDFPVMLRYHKL